MGECGLQVGAGGRGGVPWDSAPVPVEHPCTPPLLIHSLSPCSLLSAVDWGAQAMGTEGHASGREVLQGAVGPRGVRVVSEPAKSGQAPQRRGAGLGSRDEGRELGAQRGERQVQVEPGPRRHR